MGMNQAPTWASGVGSMLPQSLSHLILIKTWCGHTVIISIYINEETEGQGGYKTYPGYKIQKHIIN